MVNALTKTLTKILQCSALMFATAVYANSNPIVLRVMAQENFPPKWIEYGNRVEGICPDILTAIEKIEPRLRFTGQDDARSLAVMEKEIEAGRIDALCALLDTPRRRQVAQIIDQPLYNVRHKLAAASTDPVVVNRFEDLIKLRSPVNTTRNAGYTHLLREKGINVDDSSSDIVTNLKKVIAGHARFTYMNELTLTWIVRDKGIQEKIRILPVVLKEEPIYLWVGHKLDPAVVKMIQDALNKLAANGELARIYERWLNATTK